MHSNFLHLSLSFGNFRMVLYWISDDFERFLDFNEPNFVRLVLEAQKELAKILWNLDAEGIDALALAWRPSTVSRKPPNYALKEGRNRVTNVRIWSKLRWGRSYARLPRTLVVSTVKTGFSFNICETTSYTCCFGSQTGFSFSMCETLSYTRCFNSQVSVPQHMRDY